MPSEQPTIQAGLNAVASNDTVPVASGVYFVEFEAGHYRRLDKVVLVN